jgi:hypothetical protein
MRNISITMKKVCEIMIQMLDHTKAIIIEGKMIKEEGTTMTIISQGGLRQITMGRDINISIL